MLSLLYRLVYGTVKQATTGGILKTSGVILDTKTQQSRQTIKLDPIQKSRNAERPLVAPLQGAGFGGGALPRVALGSYGASLTLGCIRLPLRGTKWTDSQEKTGILAGNLSFSGESCFCGCLTKVNTTGKVRTI